jgi:hypothetical protein
MRSALATSAAARGAARVLGNREINPDARQAPRRARRAGTLETMVSRF